jgi:uncharacterized protein (UPF0218 family)
LAIRHRFVDPGVRKLVSQPLAEVLSEEDAVERVGSSQGICISVGDVVSRTFLERGLSPKVIVFDEKTRREKTGFPAELMAGYSLHEAENPAGTISEEASLLLKKLISHSGKSALKILGEEDLLGLPAIDLAPVGSLVSYGQPGRGIVVVVVDQESKKTARRILDKSRVS